MCLFEEISVQIFAESSQLFLEPTRRNEASSLLPETLSRSPTALQVFFST